VKDFLEEVAKKKPVPSDWCYINNFDEPYEPKAIRLPPGEGKNFQTAISGLIAEVQRTLPKAFESEEFAARREATIKAIQEERNELFSQLNERAQKEGFVLQSTPIGLLIIPVRKGKPLSDRDFLSLSPQIRNEIQERREKVNADLRGAMRQIRSLEGKINEEIQKLNKDVALYSIGHLFDNLEANYKDFPEVVAYLDKAQEDILENLTIFITPTIIRQRKTVDSIFLRAQTFERTSWAGSVSRSVTRSGQEAFSPSTVPLM